MSLPSSTWNLHKHAQEVIEIRISPSERISPFYEKCNKSHLATSSILNMVLITTNELPVSKGFIQVPMFIRIIQILLYIAKGQIISETIFLVLNFSKPKRNVCKILPQLLGQNIFVRFVGELRFPKSPFEINRPLRKSTY